MVPQTEEKMAKIISIICKYIIKKAFRQFESEIRLSSLQRIVCNLRLTSKDLNKSLCDELSLEIMHRWMKGALSNYLNFSNENKNQVLIDALWSQTK